MKPISLLFICMLTIAVCAQQSEKQERKPLTRTEPERIAKAQELLNQARVALSQGLKLDAIQTTHLPLLLRFVISGIARPAAVMMPHGTSQAEGMQALEIARQQAAAKPPGQQEREKLILFEDYRAVDGILFPHKITTQINGKLIEEPSFSKFKVNQPINPEKFAEKK